MMQESGTEVASNGTANQNSIQASLEGHREVRSKSATPSEVTASDILNFHQQQIATVEMSLLIKFGWCEARRSAGLEYSR
ncbi:Forkhead box protein P1-B [Triplophysa tibetana]|uniref:Forkhead box protein P1-B n=1 Tax=Triplophysa tibetana TaxID=1572043 RepID=A0A5A9NVJ6_9TELE|nr:Forkhead box protein P1-B [Triplophysa tibetana]